MIVSHRRRLVYIGPPKTASTTLHRWLSQPAFCDERWSPKGKNQHAVSVPEQCRGYFVFASVRHPLDREVSLWAHSQSPASRQQQGLPQLLFSQFVREFQPTATPFYRLGQAEWLAATRLDAVVRIDRLYEDLLRIPAIAEVASTLEPLQNLNRIRHRPWNTYYTSTLEEIVSDRFRDDFDLVEANNACSEA